MCMFCFFIKDISLSFLYGSLWKDVKIEKWGLSDKYTDSFTPDHTPNSNCIHFLRNPEIPCSRWSYMLDLFQNN